MLLLGWKCWEQSWGSSHTSAEDAEVKGKARKQQWEQKGARLFELGGVCVCVLLKSILAILGLKMSQVEGGGDFSGSPQVQLHVK